MQKIKEWVLNFRFLFAIFVLATVLVSMQRYFPAHNFLGKFSHYNNYILFKQSIMHLLNHQDMYIGYEQDGAYDLYKYSPTFAVFMLPYAYLPDLLGLILWNLTNTLLVFYAIRNLPKLSDRNKQWMMWFVLPELILSAQSCQSNALIAALFVLTFMAFENKNVLMAAIFIGVATIIKPYAAVAGVLFLFYPEKLKFILMAIITGVVLIALPLILVSFNSLQIQYESWFRMLANDYSNSTGISVMALVNDITQTAINKTVVIAIGTLLTFSSLLYFKRYQNFHFRTQLLALIMIWVVIFNHKSESPTFIIPVLGVALWYFYDSYSKFNFILLMTVLIFTQLSPSDVFPPYIRHEVFEKIHMKVIPCFVVWATILTTLFLQKNQQSKFSIEDSIA